MSSLGLRELSRVLEQVGVTTEDWMVLEAPWERDGRTHGGLVEGTWRDKATLTRLVDGWRGGVGRA